MLSYINIRTSIQEVFQPVNIDLTLSDVASEIRNGMGDIIVGHSQNRNLRIKRGLSFRCNGVTSSTLRSLQSHT